jgi:hypothetical protein
MSPDEIKAECGTFCERLSQGRTFLWAGDESSVPLGEGAREMAKAFFIPRRDGLQCGRLPLRRTVPLIAGLSIVSWAAVSGVIYFGRLAICSLGGI